MDDPRKNYASNKKPVTKCQCFYTREMSRIGKAMWKVDSWLPRTRGIAGWGSGRVTAKGNRVSFEGKENVLKMIVLILC